jgi:hypothetical protein
VARYLAVAWGCLLFLGGLYVVGLRRAE